MTLRLNNDNNNSASIDYVDGVSTDISVTIPEVDDATFVVSDTNGDVSIGGGNIQLNADGSAQVGAITRTGWVPNEIIQTRVYSDNGIGTFSTTAMGSVQQTNFLFTPRSTNSTIVFEYWFSNRTANVAATNTAANYQIRTSYGNGPTMISSSFSASGDDGSDDIASMMEFFNNTATNQIFALLDGSVSGSGASARCRDITCKITEIQN